MGRIIPNIWKNKKSLKFETNQKLDNLLNGDVQSPVFLCVTPRVAQSTNWEKIKKCREMWKFYSLRITGIAKSTAETQRSTDKDPLNGNVSFGKWWSNENHQIESVNGILFQDSCFRFYIFPNAGVSLAFVFSLSQFCNTGDWTKRTMRRWISHYEWRPVYMNMNIMNIRSG
jgi:hypothetical protein